MSQISDIVDTTLRNCGDRWRFRDGVRHAAIEAASKARGSEAIVDAISGTLRKYRIEPVA